MDGLPRRSSLAWPCGRSLTRVWFRGSRRRQFAVKGSYNEAIMEFKRITTNADQMGGVPCLRGLRIPVATIVSLVAEGQTVERILILYPDLEADDVREALLFAAEAVRERTLPLAARQ
jgi:uncharacterized protein (DUF433 family)